MNLSKLSILLPAFLLFIAGFTSSCSKDDEMQEPTQEEIIEQMLDEVRATTSAYHDHAKGIEAGWSNDLSGCVAHPTEGGMGHHFARMEYVDGRVNHVQPQILLYEPHEDGSFELVGVEYIIPFAILPADADAPELFFQKFHANPVQEIWALHVWTEKENLKGIFYDWNPNVTCE